MSFVDTSRIPLTGNPVIDEMHMQLAQSVNDLYDLWKGGANGSDVADGFFGLVEKLERHFVAENVISRGAGFSDWEGHKKSHDDMLDQLRALAAEVRSHPERLSVDAFVLMDDVLFEHEFNEDIAYWETFSPEGGAAAAKTEDLIPWNDDLITGKPEVDNEHKELVDQLNKLHRLVADGADKADILKLLADVRSHTAEHFESEEELMKTIGVEPQRFGYHRLAHQILLEDLDSTYRKYENGEFENLEDLLKNSLKYWLIDHIINMDSKI